jgi:chaperonin GroES
MNLRTLGDIVLCTKENPPDKSPGGIWIPDSALCRSYEEKGLYFATVIVAGPDCKELKIGDQIMFARSTYVRWSYKDKEYRGLRERDVLAIVKENDYDKPRKNWCNLKENLLHDSDSMRRKR